MARIEVIPKEKRSERLTNTLKQVVRRPKTSPRTLHMVMWIPDKKRLQALGTISVRHGQLDYAIRLIIKKLQGETIEKSLVSTGRDVSSKLTTTALKLAKEKLGVGPVYDKLAQMLTSAGNAIERRNEFIHSMYFKDTRGQTGRERHGVKHTLPSVADLMEVARVLRIAFRELDNAQSHRGWLRVALKKRGLLA